MFLGVRDYKQIPLPGLGSDNLNDYKENQCRIYGAGVNPVNSPTNAGVKFLIVDQTGYGFVLQKFVSHKETSVEEYARYWNGSSWSGWCQI